MNSMHVWWRWLTQRDTWVWLAIAVVVRGALFHVFLHEHGLHAAWYGWGAEVGDTPGYFEPIESYLAGHAYLPDHRTPGYGLPYLMFRWFTTPQGAGTATIFLQCLLGMASVVVLARCARLLDLPRWAQFATCIGFAAFPIMAVYDVYWFTESFCTSAMVFATHAWIAHVRSGSRAALIWGGAWMAWAVFLRPVQVLWLLLLAAGFIVITQSSWRKKFTAVLLFLLPFLLIDGWWVRRNAIMHATLTPLSSGIIIPELRRAHVFPLLRFMQTTGGNYIWWDPSADIRWFNMREGALGRHGPRQDIGVVMPEFALSRSITSDSLRLLAMEMERWSDRNASPEQRRVIDRAFRERCERFIRYYRAERPWQYHIGSRLRLTGLFFDRAGSGHIFHEPPHHPGWFVKPLAAADRPMHWAVIIGGILGALLALARWRRDPMLAWLALLTLTSVFIVPWALRMCEGRYIVPMYPWLLLFAVLSIQTFIGGRPGIASPTAREA